MRNGKLYYMERNELKIHVELGHSSYHIAKVLNISPSKVRYWLKKFGLSTKPYRPCVPKCRCGETNPANFYGHKTSTCAKCHNGYTKKVGQETKQYVIAKLGGRCSNCAYNKYAGALDIHHTNPKLKDPNFRSLKGWGRARIDKEINSCILLCKNCHAEIHQHMPV